MLDAFERQILEILQSNGRVSSQELSEAVGLSPSPCWRRVKRLERDGYVQRYTAILDGKKLGFNAFAYVQVSLLDHTEASTEAFARFVEQSSQVLECASITGDFDYLLKIVARDPEHLEAFIMKRILRSGVVRNTATLFVMRQMKQAGALPVALSGL